MDNSIQKTRYQALIRVLKTVSGKSAKAITYGAVLLGTAALIPNVQLPPELVAIAGGVGVEAMGNLLDRVANNDISDDALYKEIEHIISQLNLDELLTKDDFYHAFSHLRKGQRSLGSKNVQISGMLENLEKKVDSLIENKVETRESTIDIKETRHDIIEIEVVSLRTGEIIEVAVPLDIQVGYFAEQIAEHFGLPQKIEKKWNIRYEFVSKTQRRRLDNQLTLRQNKVTDRERLSIYMVAPGG